MRETRKLQYIVKVGSMISVKEIGKKCFGREKVQRKRLSVLKRWEVELNFNRRQEML